VGPFACLALHGSCHQALQSTSFTLRVVQQETKVKMISKAGYLSIAALALWAVYLYRPALVRHRCRRCSPRTVSDLAAAISRGQCETSKQYGTAPLLLPKDRVGYPPRQLTIFILRDTFQEIPNSLVCHLSNGVQYLCFMAVLSLCPSSLTRTWWPYRA
jgi:hypothetical protein